MTGPTLGVLVAPLVDAGTAEGSTGEVVTFWICAVLAVIGAIGLVFSRKTVHSALFVALTMMNLAVLYVLNGAPFLVQVIVYTGAVMMLFLFVLMLIGVDSSDSLVETLKGQRWAAGLLVLAIAIIAIVAIGGALSEATSRGILAANAEYGGNVEGLAHLMFTRYLLPLEIVASLLIVAALGALVLAHRERWAPKKDQTVLSDERVDSFRMGEHPGPLPSPGVLATSNAIGTPALLPDGTPAELSIPVPLRGRRHPNIAADTEHIESDRLEVQSLTPGGAEAERPADLTGVSGHTDLEEVYPHDHSPDAGTGEAELPPAPDPGADDTGEPDDHERGGA